MKNLSQLGRALFVIAVWGLAIQAFICAKVIFELEPAPTWIHDQVVLANLTGFFLVAVGIGLLLPGLADLASMSLAGVLLFWVLFLHIPLFFTNPTSDLSFTFETLALAGIAWGLATSSQVNAAQQSNWSVAIRKLAPLGRYTFGVSLVAFCAVNFIYHDEIGDMIPAWIPAHQFWAYFTGVASLAAGASIIAGIWDRLALIMAGIMYGSWVLIIHIPYVSAHPSAREMWTDMFITLALAGGSWFLSGTVSVGESARSRSLARAMKNRVMSKLVTQRARAGCSYESPRQPD